MEILSFLLNALAGIFLLFRVGVAIKFNSDQYAMCNKEMEIVLIFVTLILLLLIIKRKRFAGVVYFLIYSAYFGYTIYTILSNQEELSQDGIISLLISSFAIFISFANMVDVIFNNSRRGRTLKKETEWFYSTNDYERKHDDRDDRNQYRI